MQKWDVILPQGEGIPAHPYGRGKRVVWRFRISVIASQSKSRQGNIKVGSPEVARLEKQ